MIALMALNILAEMNTPMPHDTQSLHEQIESMKLAFTDGQAFITEPSDMPIKPEHLLSKEYAQQRAAKIAATATIPEPYELPKGGTVYLATADGEGNMVSFIQSNYMGFGSGIVIPGTGIALQNRGADFSLDPNHPNALKPGKRTFHTIIPGFLTKDGQAIGPFGVMGGYMQPQGHFQVAINTIDYKLKSTSSTRRTTLAVDKRQSSPRRTGLPEPSRPSTNKTRSRHPANPRLRLIRPRPNHLAQSRNRRPIRRHRIKNRRSNRRLLTTPTAKAMGFFFANIPLTFFKRKSRGETWANNSR